MTKSISIILSLLFGISTIQSCFDADDHSYESKNGQPQNRLKNSTSPYLQQHADNPVDWYPWGDEAFQKAKEDSKLVIISIGYSACHWCHVMEHKSFMDSTVAQVMNDNYVSIKVDREQRPDVDETYMKAARMTSGSGGWPLNAIALPNGKPVVAGTYFPKDKWMKFLKRTHRIWENNPQRLRQQANKVANGIQKSYQIQPRNAKSEFQMTFLDQYWEKWKGSIDFEKGGDQGKMKFPKPNGWQYLLRYHYLTGNKKALEAVSVTLKNMARGGIHDHIGGGFARYSTDPDWKVPHFEKMLYDNGQLMALYAEAYKVTQNPLYKEVVYKMHDFIQRHMLSPKGGFYSSLNADSEGEEGKYYIWTYEQLEKILSGDNLELFTDYYSVTKGGNWEHDKNVLHRTESKKEIAEAHDLMVEELDQKMERLEQKVFKVRKKRVLPSKDTKILTEWNALMLMGYIKAYEAFGDQTFLKMARNNAQFLSEEMVTSDFEVYRDYKDGEVNIKGFLDDYSFLIEAYVAFYQVTFDRKWLDKARQLAETAVNKFYDKNQKIFLYSTSRESDLISGQVETQDNVVPASNSSMAKGLFYIGTYFYEQHDNYISMTRQMLSTIQPRMQQAPDYFSNWAALMTYFVKSSYEVAIVGTNYQDKLTAFHRQFLPTTLLMGSKSEGELALLKNKYVEGETRIYVCQNKVCQQPVTVPKEALSMIR